MDVNKPTLIILTDLADQLITLMQMPLLDSKFSKKTFTKHQKFKLIILKTYLGFDYRKFVEFLKTSTIPEYLGMDRIPCFTTLQKFAKSLQIQDLEKYVAKCGEMQGKKCYSAGLDATGYSINYASKHYEKRIGRIIKRKDFMKSNMFFDLTNLMILAVKIRKTARHDTRDLRAIWNKIKHIDFGKVYADKGYDADWFHGMIFESGRQSLIHVRNESLPIHRTHGIYRKKAKRLRKNNKKGIRSRCEGIISVLKRLFGSVIRARTLATQKIELLIKIITYNLDRIMKIKKICSFILSSFLRIFVNFTKLISQSSSIVPS